jgi:hypothetical protein
MSAIVWLALHKPLQIAMARVAAAAEAKYRGVSGFPRPSPVGTLAAPVSALCCPGDIATGSTVRHSVTSIPRKYISCRTERHLIIIFPLLGESQYRMNES